MKLALMATKELYFFLFLFLSVLFAYIFAIICRFFHITPVSYAL